MGVVKVTMMSRSTCGSCARVAAQIEPLVRDHGGSLEIVDVDRSADLAAEFGDRVPVILVDDEEVACWEIDDDELIDAMEGARGA